jgi:hypothetical protein
MAEAVAVLERRGVEVSFGPEGFVAAASPAEPEPLVRAQGVDRVYRFGFSVRQVGEIWFFRHELPPKPAEQYSTLGEVVTRGLALFDEYSTGTT